MTDLLIPKIFEKIKRTPGDPVPYEDLFDISRDMDPKDMCDLVLRMRSQLAKNMSLADDADRFFQLYRKSLLMIAPYNLDSYFQYLEIDREPSERFYLPRRKILKHAVDCIQKLADDELDELFLSMPPRVGKTTLLMFTASWLIGRNCEASNLYCAFSDVITRAFYNGVLEIITDPHTYKWQEVFPKRFIAATNSQEETINLDRKRRYPSLTCRSLYGTLNGACDCNGFEISDDLIGGIEEALNKDRLVAAWSKVDNNLLPRAKEKAKILWCGTRWSIADPAGTRMGLLQEDERFKNRRYEIINLPALNEDGESNFHYAYNVGFSTEYYEMRRASFERNNDIASWNAQYMGEPIERDGTLFQPDDLRYYNGELPPGDPDRVFCAVDPAFGGGDFVAAPICYQYGDDVYIHDVIYSNEDKKVTQPLLAEAVVKHNIAAMQIEANKMTEAYKEGVSDLLKKKGIRINLTTKTAPNDRAKEQKIFDKAPDIRELMIFRESGKRSREYDLFMQNVFSFKITGKNKHDDAPDSLAQAVDMILGRNRRVQVFNRPF